MGMGTYTTPVSYSTSFTGVQEGVVAVYQNNGGLSAENATGVMMKVLLSPAQQSLTVSSVDLTVSPSSIAGTTCGSYDDVDLHGHVPCADQQNRWNDSVPLHLEQRARFPRLGASPSRLMARTPSPLPIWPRDESEAPMPFQE